MNLRERKIPVNKETPKESTKLIETVDKAFDILECFLDSGPELTLKELSEMTGLYKSRILRICGTLMAHGVLIRLQRSTYRLGPKLMSLGKAYERSNTLISLARPDLRELAVLTGESTSLFVIDGTKRLCLVREEGPSPIRYSITEGERLELHAGAGGKALLAFAPEKIRNRVLSGKKLKKLTTATFVKREQLEKELETIRKDGYAISKGERTSEAASIAVPVYDISNLVCAVITVAGPIQRFSKEHCQDMLAHLLASAKKLSFLLGQKGPG